MSSVPRMANAPPAQVPSGPGSGGTGAVKLGAVLGTVGAVLTITLGMITLSQFLQNRVEKFEGDVTGRVAAESLISFLNSHDSKVVWLDVTCKYSSLALSCDGNKQPNFDENALLPVNVNAGKYWLHIYTEGSDVQAD